MCSTQQTSWRVTSRGSACLAGTSAASIWRQLRTGRLAGSRSPPAQPAPPRAARPANARQVASYALVNTQLGACTAMPAWMGIEWWRRRKPSGVGIATGAVAGLAAITPASGYVQPWAAIIIGAAAGLLCYGAVHLKGIFHYDDSLDVVGVHM